LILGWGFWGLHHLNLPTVTPVAMATKFGAKSAITLLVYEISMRSLCITVFQGEAIE